jgi:mRNA interferase MazF
MIRGEIWFVKFPPGGRGGTKGRPAVFLTDPVGPVPELLTAYLSSQIPGTLLPSDIVLDPGRPENAGTNLSMQSVLRLHKLATVYRRDVVRKLGILSPVVLAELESRLRNLLKL